MSDDIVAELEDLADLWMAEGADDVSVLTRARDEILTLRAERQEMAAPVIDTRCAVVTPLPVCPWCKAPMLAVRSGGVMMWMCDAVSDHPSA